MTSVNKIVIGLMFLLLTFGSIGVASSVAAAESQSGKTTVKAAKKKAKKAKKKAKSKKNKKAKKKAAKCKKPKKGKKAKKKCKQPGVGRHNIVPARCPVIASPVLPNPIHMQEMPIYDGPQDPANKAYNAATGQNKVLLGKIALVPKVMWIGPGTSTSIIGTQIQRYIQDSQKGDPNMRIQLALFGLFPRGEWNRHIPLTNAEVNTYKAWINAAANVLGNTKSLIILEPDLAVNFTGAKPQLKMQLVRYAAQRLSQNPNAIIYLDGSDGDWLTVPEATSMLIQAGIQHVRGFALGSTHYASDAQNLAFGEQVSAMLAGCGYPGKHFVVDSSDTGAPFTWLEYYAARPKGMFDNAEVCAFKGQAKCITLGVLPTTNTGSPHADAFLWFGRPWLYKQANPFDMGRALAVATTTPHQ